MRWNKEAYIYEVTLTKDGFGGETESLAFLYKVDCIVTAFGETEQAKKYGLHGHKYFKLITADDMPSQDIYWKVTIDGKTYKPYSDRRFGVANRKAIMIERVD